MRGAREVSVYSLVGLTSFISSWGPCRWSKWLRSERLGIGNIVLECPALLGRFLFPLLLESCQRRVVHISSCRMTWPYIPLFFFSVLFTTIFLVYSSPLLLLYSRIISRISTVGNSALTSVLVRISSDWGESVMYTLLFYHLLVYFTIFQMRRCVKFVGDFEINRTAGKEGPFFCYL
jgi:hypothetical protein